MSEASVREGIGHAAARAPGSIVDHDAIVPAPFGALGVRVRGDAVTAISFLPPAARAVPPVSRTAAEAVRQLAAYLRDPWAPFTLKLAPSGTAFQRRVWAAIVRIPVGQTRTYGDLAHELGSVPRAVGRACGANPLPVVVPCHRVVAVSGLGGFAHQTDGDLIRTKRWLLAHEAG
jgi:methylated-DNA-[protein]-cysteine S-methyltransferase